MCTKINIFILAELSKEKRNSRVHKYFIFGLNNNNVDCWWGATMGSKNSKEKEKDMEFTGPMGVMHDKYGSAATHQCHKWVKLGFSEKGTFSFNQG